MQHRYQPHRLSDRNRCPTPGRLFSRAILLHVYIFVDYDASTLNPKPLCSAAVVLHRLSDRNRCPTPGLLFSRAILPHVYICVD